VLRVAAGAAGAVARRARDGLASVSRPASAASTPGGGASPRDRSPARRDTAHRATLAQHGTATSGSSSDNLSELDFAQPALARGVTHTARPPSVPRLRLTGGDATAAATAADAGAPAAPRGVSLVAQRLAALEERFTDAPAHSRAAAPAWQPALSPALLAARCRAEAEAQRESERLGAHAADLVRRLQQVEQAGAAAERRAEQRAFASGWRGSDECDEPRTGALPFAEPALLQAVVTIQAAFWSWQARKLDAARRGAAALLLQSAWRGSLARAAFAQRWESHVAATIVQSVWRGRTARTVTVPRRIAAKRACVRIQAAVRGHLTRVALFTRLEYEDAAAVSIQAAWRGYLGRRRVSALRAHRQAAAVCIQAAWMRSRAARLRETRDDVAATVLQATWRGYLARQSFAQRRWLVTEAVRTIQACWRRQTRRRSAAVLAAHRNAAALRIQAAWLGWLANRMDAQRQGDAALTIQRHWRGAAVRQALSAASDRTVAQTLIAAAWRGRLARAEAGKLKGHVAHRQAAAIAIQAAFWRKKSVQLDAARRAQAALRVQAAWRGVQARGQVAAERDRHVAAVVIQSSWRGHRARRATHVVRATAAEANEAGRLLAEKRQALAVARAKAQAAAARVTAIADSCASPTKSKSANIEVARGGFAAARTQAMASAHAVLAPPQASSTPAASSELVGGALGALSRVRAAAEARAGAHAAQRAANVAVHAHLRTFTQAHER
jgi:hypothetical protein